MSCNTRSISSSRLLIARIERRSVKMKPPLPPKATFSSDARNRRFRIWQYFLKRFGLSLPRASRSESALWLEATMMPRPLSRSSSPSATLPHAMAAEHDSDARPPSIEMMCCWSPGGMWTGQSLGMKPSASCSRTQASSQRLSLPSSSTARRAAFILTSGGPSA